MPQDSAALARVHAAALVAELPYVKRARDTDHLSCLQDAVIYAICKEAQRHCPDTSRGVSSNSPRIKAAMAKLSSQTKQADNQLQQLLDNLKSVAGTARDKLVEAGGNAGNHIQSARRAIEGYNYNDLYQRIRQDPVANKALIGALIGAPTMGASALLSGDDVGGTLKNTIAGLLVGSLLGGGAGLAQQAASSRSTGSADDPSVPPPPPRRSPGSTVDSPSASSKFVHPTLPGRLDDVTLSSKGLGVEGVPNIRLHSDELEQFLNDIEGRWPVFSKDLTKHKVDGMTGIPGVDDWLSYVDPRVPTEYMYGGSELASIIGHGAAMGAVPGVSAAFQSEIPADMYRRRLGSDYLYDTDRLKANSELAFEKADRTGMNDSQRAGLPDTGSSRTRHLAKLLQQTENADLQEAAKGRFSDQHMARLVDKYLQTDAAKGHFKALGVEDHTPDQDWLERKYGPLVDHTRAQVDNDTITGRPKAVQQPPPPLLDKDKRPARHIPSDGDVDAYRNERLRSVFLNDQGKSNISPDDLENVYRAAPTKQRWPMVDSKVRQWTGLPTADKKIFDLRNFLRNRPASPFGKIKTPLQMAGGYLGHNLLGQYFGPTTDDDIYNHVQGLLQDPSGQVKYDEALQAIFDRRREADPNYKGQLPGTPDFKAIPKKPYYPAAGY